VDSFVLRLDRNPFARPIPKEANAQMKRAIKEKITCRVPTRLERGDFRSIVRY